MLRRDLRLSGLFPLVICFSVIACASQTASTTSTASPEMPAAATASSSYPSDGLQLKGDRRAVLATIGGKPAVSLGEFNDRIPEFPVPDRGQGLVVARREVLDRLIRFKVMAYEAKRRREEAKLPPLDRPSAYEAERVLVMSLTKESVANPSLATDEEARKYFEENSEKFKNLDHPDVPPEARLLYAKFTLLSERFGKTVDAWQAQDDVKVAEDLLKD